MSGFVVCFIMPVNQAMVLFGISIIFTLKTTISTLACGKEVEENKNNSFEVADF